MLCSTFLWDYQHLYPQVSLLVELMLSMLASSAVVERGIKMCLLLYATFPQLGMITLPMQKSVKNLILSSLVRVFFQALFQLRQIHFLGQVWHLHFRYFSLF